MYRQCALNLRDGRVVLCTNETLTNIDYYAISEKVAKAIESGILNRKEVIAKVKGKLLTSQEEWDALLTKKTTQNVRHSDIKAEDAERSETRIEKEDVETEFDMEIPGEIPEPAPAPDPAPAPAPALAPAQPQNPAPTTSAPATQVQEVPDPATSPAPAPKVTNKGGSKRGKKTEQNPFEAKPSVAADQPNAEGDGLDGLGE